MKKSIFLICLLTFCFAGSVFAAAPITNTSNFIKMKGDGVIKSAVVFNDKSLQANIIDWSAPVDMSELAFDDVRVTHGNSVTMTQYNKACLSLFIARANTSTATQNGGITLTYLVSNDGYGWFPPPDEDGELQRVSTGNFSWTTRHPAGMGWGGKGIFALTDALGFTKDATQNVAQQWQAATTAGTSGPYMLTLTGVTKTFVSPAKYIKFGAVQPEASKSVIFDLIISGKGKAD